MSQIIFSSNSSITDIKNKKGEHKTNNRIEIIQYNSGGKKDRSMEGITKKTGK